MKARKPKTKDEIISEIRLSLDLLQYGQLVIGDRKNLSDFKDLPNTDKKIIPRPSRRGVKNYSWPLEHLASIRALFLSFPDSTAREIVKLLDKWYPDVRKHYEEKQNKRMSVNVVSQRNDKGEREGEERNYKHLMSKIIKDIKRRIKS